MLQYLKTRWELFLVLAIFIVVKLPALHYPFYWDESWSYAPGVKLMYLHGPSLMPNAIDLFYSRGHPLLFYASAASWMRIFGDSHISQHAFCLFLSVLVVFSVYEISLKIFSRRTAVISLLLVPLQVSFYVQSTMLLPEVMIGLLSLLTLYFYSREKHLLTFFFCSALLLTKESGVAIGAVLGVCSAANLLNKNVALSSRIKTFFSVFFAGCVIVTFYLLQKKLNGWYLFPEHTNMVVWKWQPFWDKFRFSMDVLLAFDQKFRIFELLCLLSVIAAIRSKNIRYAIPLLPAYFIYVAIDSKMGWMPEKIRFALLLVPLSITAYQLAYLQVNKTAAKQKFIYLSFIFVIAYLFFSCINFFTPRYLMAPLIVLMLLSAAWFDLIIPVLHKNVFYIVLLFITGISLYGFYTNTGLGDVSLGAFDGMAVEQNVVTHAEQQNWYDKHIAAPNFQNTEHLTKPYTGFLKGTKTFTNITADIRPNTDFIIIDNIEPNGRLDTLLKTDSNYQLVYRTASGKAWEEVYEKRK